MGTPRFLPARRHKFVDRRTGSIAMPLASAVWATLDATADITVEAQVGDVLLVDVNGLWGSEMQNGFLDVATWVSGAGVHWFGSGEPTTNTGGGVQTWYADGGVAGVYYKACGAIRYTVQAGDIVNGDVTLRLRYRVTGNKTLYNTALNPFQWSVENIGPVQPN